MGIDRMDGNGEYEKLIVDRALKKKKPVLDDRGVSGSIPYETIC
jgi:hypothetical protein